LGSFFCAPHILAISLSLYLIKWRTPEGQNEAHTNKLMLLPLSPSRTEQVEEPHSTFSPTLCFILSHLAHFDEDPSNQQGKRLKVSHRSTKEDDHVPTLGAMFLFISLLLASSFFESRDEIPFRG
jgi:hypothetical protein